MHLLSFIHSTHQSRSCAAELMRRANILARFIKHQTRSSATYRGLPSKLRRCTRDLWMFYILRHDGRFSGRGRACDRLSRFRDVTTMKSRYGKDATELTNLLPPPASPLPKKTTVARPVVDKIVFQFVVMSATHLRDIGLHQAARVCKHGEYLHLRVCGRQARAREQAVANDVDPESNELYGAHAIGISRQPRIPMWVTRSQKPVSPFRESFRSPLNVPGSKRAIHYH